MRVYFSPSLGGFFDEGLHGDQIPVDAVLVGEEQRQELLAAQAAGMGIVAGEDGQPVAVARPGPTQEQLIASARFWRDAQLSATDAMVLRHRDELDAGRPTTLTDEQYQQVQAYRLELRDWPSRIGFPDAGLRPVEPEWLNA